MQDLDRQVSNSLKLMELKPITTKKNISDSGTMLTPWYSGSRSLPLSLVNGVEPGSIYSPFSPVSRYLPIRGLQS